MRLIDGDEVIKRIAERQDKSSTGIEDCAFYEAIKIVRNAPTVEAEPVKHGRWIIHREEIFEPNRSECYINRPLPTECSVCGFAEMRASRFAFCPNCGTRMDGDET